MLRSFVKAALLSAALLWLAPGVFAQCAITLNPASSSVGAPVGNYSIAVTTSADCTRNAVSNNDWLTVSFGQNSGGKSSSIGYTVTENLSPQPRTGTITVSVAPPFTDPPVVYTIRQAGANCTYSFSPGTTINVATKNVAAFLLNVTTRCIWNASTTSDWIALSTNGPFTGNGSTAVSVSDNTSTTLRRGTILVNDQAVVIQQNGVVCSYQVSPPSASVVSGGGTVKFTVNTDPACSWTASSNASWISLVNSPPPGPGTVTATVAASSTPQSRSTALTVAGQAVTVTQAGVGISFSASSIQNASSFASGALSPGEIFVLYGSGLGPQSLTTLQTTSDGKAITTSLGGTRILFDGVPSPMIYTSSTQISAIVPYSVFGPVAHITVEYLGIASSPVTVNIMPATPGIFTISQNGSGQGAVRNQDFSVNGATNAAISGQALIVYWTGGGSLNITVPDGQLVSVNPPYPSVTFPVTATLGGVPVQVLYAGAVPTLAPGILQTNILIPDSAPKGDAVPLLMRIGDFSTQTGVSVAIH